MQCEVTTVIHRPVSVVWDFYALHHIENHPRWDPDIELEKVTDGPIDVGTVIRRRSTRFEPSTEGTIEITEFDPERTMRGQDAGRFDDDQRLGAVCGTI